MMRSQGHPWGKSFGWLVPQADLWRRALPRFPEAVRPRPFLPPMRESSWGDPVQLPQGQLKGSPFLPDCSTKWDPQESALGHYS